MKLGRCPRILRAMRLDKRRQNIVASQMAEWGRRGGAARAGALTPKQRREIAKKAAAASAKVRSAKARRRKATR